MAEPVLVESGGPMIKRCGDCQRKYDGLEKWSLHLVDSLPVMLQVALLLLACGLCRHMWSVNASVAYVLISFASLGIVFYVANVTASTLLYAYPFRTNCESSPHLDNHRSPPSTGLRIT